MICIHASEPTDRSVRCGLDLFGGLPSHGVCVRCTDSRKRFVELTVAQKAAVEQQTDSKVLRGLKAHLSSQSNVEVRRRYANTSGPHWGVVAWSKLFTAAVPSAELMQQVVDSLPPSKCSCRIDAHDYLKSHPADPDHWFEYLYEFHAHVDQMKQQPTATIDAARRRWGFMANPRRAIAVGNWFRDNIPAVSRASFKAAALRWGVEYVELTRPLRSDQSSGYQEKLYLPDHTKDFDQVLFLDGWDTIVRSDCPNLFDLVRVCDFAAVPGFQPGHDWRPSIAAHLGKLFEVAGIDGDKVQYGIPFNGDTDHFNGGLYMFSPPVHAALFADARAIAAATSDRHWSVVDEGVISLAAIRSGITINRLPMAFNRCGGSWKKQKRAAMENYIQHYCGDHANRGQIMAAVDFEDCSIPAIEEGASTTV